MIYTIKLIEISDHLTQSVDYQIILRIIFDLVYCIPYIQRQGKETN